ncbi:MAG: HD domain-containing protein [Candidatus Dojkabacteria bacterium]|jgi:GTP pyrophosphokinase|nr:HD domain-containing protein [Candidatus Dojkabacteria bacterium]
MNNTLQEQLLEYSPQNYKDIILEGISFAQKYHEGQSRLSGEEFVNHSIRTAKTLARMGLETNTILAGLFHNILSKNEDRREIIEKEISSKFGEDVLLLIEQCEDISKATGSQDTEFEIINKYILNSAKDLRVVLIKLADTLDNVRNIEYMPSEKIGSKIQKVFNIYGPLAEYLNLDSLKKELEERALQIYRPEEYQTIKHMLEGKGFTIQARDKYIAYLEELISTIPGQQIVHGRLKSIYSIYNKQKKNLKEGSNINISNIRDLLAFRIITESEDDCFKALELIMDNGEILTEEFDDYITHPKPNGYKALQGPIILPKVSNNIIELQIMSQKMYYHNTYGSASHIAYKESKSRYAKPTDKYSWVEQIHKEIENNISLREQQVNTPINVDIFAESVYAFTPKGKILQLDKGDTVVDFAYLVHTDIGNSMVSAKVNGNAVKHNYQVRTGDIVDIKTQSGKKSVNPDWILYANSPSTQAKIQKTWKKH